MTPILEVAAAGTTHQGNFRDHNEDDYLARRPVFLVADGLGGHASGEVASRRVVEAFEPLTDRDWVTAEDVLASVSRASESVRALASGDRAPGSTVTGVALSDQGGVPCWLVFNIGDSRTYLLHGERLEQLTVDHSGIRQRGGTAPPRNIVTRAIGAGVDRPPMADQWLVPAVEGQRLLLCSDGLTNELTELLIQAHLMSDPDPQVVADRLVEAALAASGRDNVTAVVVDAVIVRSDAPASDDSGDTLPDTTESDPHGFAVADPAPIT